MTTRFRALALAGVACSFALAAATARAEWMQPDPSLREAQLELRDAARDTVDHANDAAKFAALGAAQLKLARFADAERSFVRALAIRPEDIVARTGLGVLCALRGREAQAESLLALAGESETGLRTRFDLALRREDWKGALALTPKLEDEAGRAPLLERLATGEPVSVEFGSGAGIVNFERAWPVPLVKAKLNGVPVLMAIDLGATDMLIDPPSSRVAKLELLDGERSVAWMGSRVSGRNAMLASFTLGNATVRNLPAVITSLRKYSLQVNPQGVQIAGVIGLPALRRLGVTLDFRENRLELSKETPAIAPGSARVPFDVWGSGAMVVYGSIGGARKLAIQVGTGLPEAGIGSAPEVFEEFGIKPGKLANAVRSLGAVLQGRPWSRVNVPTLSFGSLVGDRVPGWAGVMDGTEFWRHGVRMDAILGPAFFRDRRVSVDWTKRELVFAPAR